MHHLGGCFAGELQQFFASQSVAAKINFLKESAVDDGGQRLLTNTRIGKVQLNEVMNLVQFGKSVIGQPAVGETDRYVAKNVAEDPS